MADLKGKTMSGPKPSAPDGSAENRKKPALRVFVALCLPETIIRWLADRQQALKAHHLPIQWVRPENIHLTLQFLGEIPEEQADAVCRAVGQAAALIPPFTLAARGVGVFPGVRRPRVLWCGLSGQTQVLADLRQAVGLGLLDLGFPAEDRPFTGHLTLGRFKDDRRHQTPTSQAMPEVLIQIMQQYADAATNPFPVDDVAVFKSDLKPGGPVYTVISRLGLGMKKF